MRVSHRTQIALVSATATGLVLGAVFAVIVFLARRDVRGDKQTELSAVMRSFTPPDDLRFDLREFHAAHPELSATVYAADGRLLEQAGRFPPPRQQGFRVVGGRLVLGTDFRGQQVVMSLDLGESERGLGRLTTALVALWFPLTLLIGGIAWGTAQAVFRPLERLSAQALAMGGSDLSERLVTPDTAEFGAFAKALNRMLDRIEETVRRGERFSADAAHELRTPLAILMTRIDTALLNRRTPDEYIETLHRARAEIVRLTDVTQALLRTARGEAPEAEPTVLEPIVREVVAGWSGPFAERGVGLDLVWEDATATITREEVRIVLDNLLDNALRFAPAGSVATVSLSRRDEVELAVADRGPGFPKDLHDRAFDRLVRGDDSRNRASGGAGIGLSMVRRIAESRGGRAFHRTTPGGGATVVVRLPAVERILNAPPPEAAPIVRS